MNRQSRRFIFEVSLRTLAFYALVVPLAFLEERSPLASILVCAGAVYIAQCVVWLSGLYRQPDARARAQRAARFLFKLVLGLAVLALLLQLGLSLVRR